MIGLSINKKIGSTGMLVDLEDVLKAVVEEAGPLILVLMMFSTDTLVITLKETSITLVKTFLQEKVPYFHQKSSAEKNSNSIVVMKAKIYPN